MCIYIYAGTANQLRPSSGKVNNTGRPAFRPPHCVMMLYLDTGEILMFQPLLITIKSKSQSCLQYARCIPL